MKICFRSNTMKYEYKQHYIHIFKTVLTCRDKMKHAGIDLLPQLVLRPTENRPVVTACVKTVDELKSEQNRRKITCTKPPNLNLAYLRGRSSALEPALRQLIEL